jgi:hypothetical protein
MHLPIRKLPICGEPWPEVRNIIGQGQLELLHIAIEDRGLHYTELIPRIVMNGSKLHSLRLELNGKGRCHTGSYDANELLHRTIATGLSKNSHKLQTLSLHADYGVEVWETIHSLRSARASDFTPGNSSASERTSQSAVAPS